MLFEMFQIKPYSLNYTLLPIFACGCGRRGVLLLTGQNSNTYSILKFCICQGWMVVLG